MIVIISGASHTGKTALAQRLLERYKFPYLSIDHLKMGLIRSGQTTLTPMDDKELVPYLWSIVSEMIKTAIENKQDLIVEGCYVPFDWRDSFDESYLQDIRCVRLVMTERYIRERFDDILRYRNVIEDRQHDLPDIEELIRDNAENLAECKSYGCEYLLIDGEYAPCIEI